MIKRKKRSIGQIVLTLTALLITILVLFIELEWVGAKYQLVVASCLVVLLVTLIAKEKT